MLSKSFRKTVQDIKSLKIQGASNVRKAAVQALLKEIEGFNDNSVLHFKADLMNAVKELLNARPTEPEMRTALRVVLHNLKEQHELGILRKSLENALKNFEKERQEALRKIAVYGARAIHENSAIMTHCHSHTVIEILKEAHRQGKIEKVYCTESRPLFQGRMSAEDLAKSGVPVIMIVDSAVSSFLKECSMFITGADAVLCDGSLVNKIGTKGISMLAESFGVPHFAACSSHKFDSATVYGFEEIIEERAGKEVWDKKMKHFSIRNPAFDITPAKYVEALITEKGIMPPQEFAGLMYEELGLEKQEKEFASLIRMMKK